MNLLETTIGTTPIFEGKIFSVHVDDVVLADGSKSKREIVEHPGGVCVAALDENENLTFVEQFRSPYQKLLLELPAGKLEKGEDPKTAALRELLEECGIKPGIMQKMGEVYPTVAYCGEIIHLFLAKNLQKVGQQLDEGEFLALKQISLDDAFKMVMENKICDSKTQILILKLATLKAEGKL